MASSKRKKGEPKGKDSQTNRLGVPRVYKKRKTYGAGGKQVAWEEFDRPRALNQTQSGRCITYTAAKGETVILTITHNDGSTQQWPIVSEGEEAGTTSGVHICYDDQGRPTSIFILG